MAFHGGAGPITSVGAMKQVDLQERTTTPIAPDFNAPVTLVYSTSADAPMSGGGLVLYDQAGLAQAYSPYKTGTYTPVIGDGTNDFTLTTASGTWTMIGNLVMVDIRVVWTSKGSASGDISVSLPWDATSGAQRHGFSINYANRLIFTEMMTARCNGGVGVGVIILGLVSAAAGGVLDNTEYSASGELQLSGTYRMADP